MIDASQTRHEVASRGPLGFAVAVFGSVALFACAVTERPARVEHADSSGVAVVTVYGTTESWTIDDVPEVLIGDESQPGDGPLYEVAGVARLDDGRIVVAERSSYSLRYYDSSGRYTMAVGGRGAGPGEFNGIDWLQQIHGDVYVYDRANRRLTRLDSAGQIVASTHFVHPRGDGITRPVGVFADGAYLIESTVDVNEWQMGINIDIRQYARGTADSLTSIYGRLFRGESYVTPYRDGTVAQSMPFGRKAEMYVVGDSWFYIDGHCYRVLRFDNTGGLVEILQVAGSPPNVTALHLAKRLDAMRDSGVSSFRQRTAREMPLPATFPGYTDVIVDGQTNVWALRGVGNEREGCWDIFRHDRSGVAQACLPPRLRPFQIGEDYLLGVILSENDVELVARYALRKSSSVPPAR